MSSLESKSHLIKSKSINTSHSGNKLTQNQGQINVKRGLNSDAKSWMQFNCNITFEIKCIIIDVNIH